MGMDIYLFEVVSDKVVDKIQDFSLSERQIANLPEKFKPFVKEKEVELIDTDRLFKDLGISEDDIIALGWSLNDDTQIILTKDRRIEIPDKELKRYSYMGKEKYLPVVERDYERYGYCSNHFKGNFSIPTLYFKPEDMSPHVGIFREGHEYGWLRIQQAFRELYEQGKLVFVWVSY